MRRRLPYFAVLLVSIAAVPLGLWPSLLTIGAILAIGTGSAALMGAIKPAVIDARRALRLFTLGGGAVLALELVAIATYLAVTPRRTVHLVVRSDSSRLVRVVYSVSDGASSSVWHWDRYFTAGAGTPALIHTRLAPDDGWFDADNPHPVVARTEAGALVPARWIAGGYTQAGSCTLAFDEYSIGPHPLAPRDPQALLTAGWLDSLATWGVACRGGRLVRSARGAPLQRTSEACYFDTAGGVSCRPGVRAS